VNLGIFSKTFTGNKPEVVLKAVKKSGFSETQYNMSCSGIKSLPEILTNEIIEDISTASKKNKVRISAISGTYNMVHPNKEIRMKGQKSIELLASYANKIPTKLITLCTGTKNPLDQWTSHIENNSKDAWQDLLVSMEKVIQIADQYQIYLGIEPELANIVNSAEKAILLINELKSPRLKIIFDPANIFEVERIKDQKYVISESIELLAEYIVMGHAKDKTISGNFIAPGKGIIDFNHYFNCLKLINFNGPLITHDLKSYEATNVFSFLKLKMEAIGIKIKH